MWDTQQGQRIVAFNYIQRPSQSTCQVNLYYMANTILDFDLGHIDFTLLGQVNLHAKSIYMSSQSILHGQYQCRLIWPQVKLYVKLIYITWQILNWITMWKTLTGIKSTYMSSQSILHGQYQIGYRFEKHWLYFVEASQSTRQVNLHVKSIYITWPISKLVSITLLTSMGSSPATCQVNLHAKSLYMSSQSILHGQYKIG